MAEYTRFEIFLPVHYYEEVATPSGKTQRRERALDPRIVARFIRSASRKYGGITRSNELAPAPYQGWWKSDTGSEIYVDHLIYLFILVRISQSGEAYRYFAGWRTRLAEKTY